MTRESAPSQSGSFPGGVQAKCSCTISMPGAGSNQVLRSPKSCSVSVRRASATAARRSVTCAFRPSQVVHPPAVTTRRGPTVRAQPELVLLLGRVHPADVVLLHERRAARALHARAPAVRPFQCLQHVELVVVEPVLVPVRVVLGG